MNPAPVPGVPADGPRANWKGFLRLSLVTCPVALYPATSDSEKISFNQINRNTGNRIKSSRVDADTGEEVPNEDMLDLAKHIVEQKSGRFEPDKFEDHYETALIDLINSKRNGKPVTAKARPRGENVVDLMDALRQSIRRASSSSGKPAKKTGKASAGQKEMLMPIEGKKAAKQASTKKSSAKTQRKSA